MKKALSVFLSLVLLFAVTLLPGLTVSAEESFTISLSSDGIVTWSPVSGAAEYIVGIDCSNPYVSQGERIDNNTTYDVVDALTGQHRASGVYSISVNAYDSSNTKIAKSNTVSYNYTDAAIRSQQASLTVRKPVTGQRPQQPQEMTLTLDHGSATMKSAMWQIKNPGYLPQEAGNVFEQGKEYQLSMTVVMDRYTYYEQSESYTFKINGKDPTYKEQRSNKEIYVMYEFGTAATEIQEISVGITEPSPGYPPSYNAVVYGAPQYYVDTSVNEQYVKNGVVWYDITDGAGTKLNPSNAVFQEGHRYAVNIYLRAYDDFAFTGDMDAEFNQYYSAAGTYDADQERMRVDYEFPGALSYIIRKAEAVIDAPEAGYHPSFTFTCLSDAYYPGTKASSGSIVTWIDRTASTSFNTVYLDADSIFLAGHQYEVYLSLLPSEGYSFAENIKDVVNGIEAEGNTILSGAFHRMNYLFPSLPTGKPVIKTVENVSTGVKISWNAVSGAAKYAVYRKGPNDTSFKKLATTAELSYTNRSVASGKTYRYAIRGISSDGVMGPYSAGKSILYLRPPVISSVTNATEGVKVSWDAVGGAAKYAVYRKGPNDTSFKKLVTTTETSYTNKNAVSGKEYRYSVRAVAADGKTMSAYSTGKSVFYVRAPVISSVTNTTTGVKIAWGSVIPAEKYYVYRKGPTDTSFVKIATTTALTYTDKNVTAGKAYRYSVRAVTSDGKMSAYSAGKSITYQKP